MTTPEKPDASETRPDAEPEEPATKQSKREQAASISDAEFSKSIGDILSRSRIPNAEEVLSLYRIAEKLWESGMFYRHKNAAGVFAVILYGMELGLSYMQSLMNVDIVDGSPAMSTQLMAAIFKSRGGQIHIIQRDEDACRVRLTWNGQTEEFLFSQDDVDRAGLNRKDSNHQKYPVAMKYWRALSDGIKTIAPECLLRAYTHDELTAGAATDPDEYRKLLEDKSSPYSRQRQPSKTTKNADATPPGAGKQDVKPTIASVTLIKNIRELIDGSIVPAEFRDRLTRWLSKHDGQWPNNDAAQAYRRLCKFTPSTSRSSSRPATEPQSQALYKLTQSEHVPEESKTRITAAFARSERPTVGVAAAWMEHCTWYIDQAAARKQQAPPDGTSTGEAETGEASSPSGNEDALEEAVGRCLLLLEHRQGEPDAVAATRAYLNSPKAELADVEAMIKEMESWPLKPKTNWARADVAKAVASMVTGDVSLMAQEIEKMIWSGDGAAARQHRHELTGKAFFKPMTVDERRKVLVELVMKGQAAGITIPLQVGS